MTVIDTSAVVDFLLGNGVARAVEELMVEETELAAPDLLVFETIAVLRRDAFRAAIPEARARTALGDLEDLPIRLFESMPQRDRAWELRRNLTAADALFVALAEALDEPVATKDSPLAAAIERHTSTQAIRLEEPPPDDLS